MHNDIILDVLFDLRCFKQRMKNGPLVSSNCTTWQ